MKIISATKAIARNLLKPPLHRPEVEMDYEVLGTVYGGWPLLSRGFDGNSIIYSFGVGEDISFDLAAIKKLGCRVRAFDPTPRSGNWVARQNLPESFLFYPVGISDRDEQAEFFEPSNAAHVSYSDAPSGKAGENRVIAEVQRLPTLLSRFGDDRIDVLKMDIEGFEYRVIADVIDNTHIRPPLWLVEFHHGMYGKSADDTRGAVSRLGAAGYKLFYVSSTGREYGFVLDDQ